MYCSKEPVDVMLTLIEKVWSDNVGDGISSVNEQANQMIAD